jgi:medium-chain acyl-[acyl-carrier-protein] hydrolase
MSASNHTTRVVANPWLYLFEPNPSATLRLFCFPYAGGGSSIFRNWIFQIPKAIEICAVQLPGRGMRVREKPFSKIPELIDAVADTLDSHLDKPFVLFGHSLGALVSYELAHELRARHGIEPLHLFVSGRHAPQLSDPEPPTYDLPQPEFIEELRRLNGTPAEVLEHPELVELLLPVLRADFELCQTYEYLSKAPLHCPITAFGGLRDEHVSRAQLESWSEQTTNAFSVRMLPGDHFFLHSFELMMLQMLALDLQRVLATLNHVGSEARPPSREPARVSSGDEMMRESCAGIV